MTTRSNTYWRDLRWSNIIGIIDSYGAIDSKNTGKKVEFHSEFWPIRHSVMWRWNFNDSIWWITAENMPNNEQYTQIVEHLEKKYGIRFWDNGHHDIDYFIAKMNEEKSA